MADADAVQDGEVITPGTSTPGEMSLVGHLTELRNRIVKSIVAVAVGSVLGAIFWKDIRNVLIAPLPTGTVQVLGPGDAFVIFLRISIIAGVILAMPVILWQLWKFIAPGLTESEQRVVRPWIPLALVFFVIGVTIAYIILPFATGFLLGFTDDVLVGNLAAGPYFDFVTTMFLAFGLIMEFPIILFGLSRVGIVTSQRLSSSRRVIILGIAIFATAITPGGDIVSPIALGGTMYILFEGTVLFIRRSGK
ncbi:MAG: twin-arginine translocase subunit TatC [Chloroflexota bacterium]